jgi:hypothetical protein
MIIIEGRHYDGQNEGRGGAQAFNLIGSAGAVSANAAACAMDIERGPPPWPRAQMRPACLRFARIY